MRPAGLGRSMARLPKLGLLDKSGKPLGSRIERVLLRLLPRIKKRFPDLRDEAVITEVMEESGRRIARREAREGPIEKLDGFAWITARNVATDYMRRSSSRVSTKTLPSDESETILASLPSQAGSREQIEQAILVREVLALVTPWERLVCLRKLSTFTTQEIAERYGVSVESVDAAFSRAKERIRAAQRVQDNEGARQQRARPAEGDPVEQAPLAPTNVEDIDDDP